MFKINKNNIFSYRPEELISPFDKMFDELISNTNPELPKIFGDSLFQKNAYPRINVISSEESVTIEASLPGLTREDVNIDVDGHNLIISSSKSRNDSGKFDDSKESDKKYGTNPTYLFREIRKSPFTRTLNLSEELDLDKISASMKDGLLTIVVPRITKKEKERLNRIKIS